MTSIYNKVTATHDICGYEALAKTIIQNECWDYMKALRNEDSKTIEECEQFFASDYAKTLLGTVKTTPDSLIRKCRKEYMYVQ